MGHGVSAVMRLLSVLLLAMLLVGCGRPAAVSEVERQCRDIANIHIVWDHGPLGTFPKIVGDNEERLLTAPAVADAFLLEALQDPKRWIVAHVILTKRHPESPPDDFDAPFWKRWKKGYNGLEVALKMNGDPIIEEEQRPAIREYWLSRLNGSLRAEPTKSPG